MSRNVYQLMNDDTICLHSVESFIRERNNNQNPMYGSIEEKLNYTQTARNFLYSEIAKRFPRIAGYILQSDIATNQYAQGLNTSLSNHLLDPNFVHILMQYIASTNSAQQSVICGAYIAKVMSKWIAQNITTDNVSTEKSKKIDKSEKADTVENKKSIDTISHLMEATKHFLSNIIAMVIAKYPTVSEQEAIAYAAAVAMNNEETISEILEGGWPITADIFDIYEDPSAVITAALLMTKDDIPAKTTPNQDAFLDSLKRWVFKKLNELQSQACYQFLVSVYGVPKGVDCSTKFINLKSCGNQFPALLTVAMDMINK